jgi:hypothetical protein
MYAKAAKSRSKSSTKYSVKSIIGWTIVIGLTVHLMYSSIIYMQLSRLAVQTELNLVADELALSSEGDAEETFTRDAFEYRSALSSCNSDVVISSYATELTSSSMINDNFCDCKQGSDEFSTSACSYLLVGHRVFQCGSSRGQIRKISLRGKVRSQTESIFPSRVNDSVCDCEDCSDEDNLGAGMHSSRA